MFIVLLYFFFYWGFKYLLKCQNILSYPLWHTEAIILYSLKYLLKATKCEMREMSYVLSNAPLSNILANVFHGNS